MKLTAKKRFRDMSPFEQRVYQARCRLYDRSVLHYLAYSYGLAPTYRDLVESGHPFAILAAEEARTRSLPSDEAARRAADRTEALRTRIKDMPSTLGYLPSWGVWKAAPDDPVSADTSIFVPDIQREVALDLGREFGQSAMIWGRGDCYWRINPATGQEVGPLPVAPRLRRLVLEQVLQDAEPACAHVMTVYSERQRPGARPFFFLRPGFPRMMYAPWGISQHEDVPGPVLIGSRDNEMRLSYLDVYLPLA